MEMIDILENLAANPSRNYKIGLLQEHAGNNLLRELVRLALDPFTQFYIRKIPKYEAKGNGCLAQAMDQLFELSSRLKTGNAGIEHLTQILTSLSPKNAMIIERIIAKDLKCGVSIATANDVWPGLIMEYPVMLCSGFEQKLIDKIQWPAMVQLKMDGMRFNAVVRDGQVEFKTRNGKTIDLLGNLEQEFIQLSNGIDCIFDGELLVSYFDGVMDRQTGNGILNKSLKGTITQTEANMVRATVWDYIPYAYFTSGHCPIPYKDRFAKLVNLPEKIRLVESTIVENIDQANELFKSYYDKGEEGIILKDMNEDWQDKRVKHQIKFKGELECDLKVVGFEPGTGKYVGKLGALICESDDGIIKVKVGSGFNDEDRESIKEQDVIGRVVAVKYNARIRSKSEDESLFLPIFLEIRQDKTQADSSGSIK
jgi:hypothetical protein